MTALATRATLRDVAQHAGVHCSTASLALRNNPRIPLATRQRVQTSATAVGYRVDPLVAALMRNRRRRESSGPVTLAYVTNHPTRFGWRATNPARPDCDAGARAEAERRGFRLEHFWHREPGIGPHRLGEILRHRGIRGVILGRLPWDQASLDFEYDRFACVALGLTPLGVPLPRVAEDHFGAVTLAMEQCAARGYQRAGLVFSTATENAAVSERRLGAFCAQQRRLPEASRVAPYSENPPSACSFARWFEEQAPDVLITTQATPVAQWLKAMRVAVPTDVGLIDLEPAAQGNVAGVCHDSARLGALAIELLVGLLQRNATGSASGPGEQVLLSGQWREGLTLPPSVECATRTARSA